MKYRILKSVYHEDLGRVVTRRECEENGPTEVPACRVEAWLRGGYIEAVPEPIVIEDDAPKKKTNVKKPKAVPDVEDERA